MNPRHLLCHTRRLSLAYSEFVPNVQLPRTTHSVRQKPVICLHGLFGGRNDWTKISTSLATALQQKVYTVDARNHGDSPASEVMKYTALADDLLEFLHDQQLEKASFVGHSMGGMSAMCLALKEPKVVDRLVAIDVAPNLKWSPEEAESIAKAVKEMDIKEIMTIAENELEMVFHRKPQEELIRRMISCNQRQHAAVNGIFKFNLLNCVNELPQIVDFPEFESTFHGKALFIMGSKSDFVARENKIKTYFPEAEIVWVDAGHQVHLEKPDEVTKLLIQYLRS